MVKHYERYEPPGGWYVSLVRVYRGESSCTVGIKTDLKPETRPTHLLSVCHGTKKGKAHPVQHIQSCQITNTMPRPIYRVQPASRSILDSLTLYLKCIDIPELTNAE